MRSTMTPFTDEEQAFATENYKLLLAYVGRHRFPESNLMLNRDDWWGLISEAYLSAVKYWFEREDLREKYAFATIFHKAADSAVRRLMQQEKCPSRNQTPARLDAVLSVSENGTEFTLAQQIPAQDAEFAERVETVVAVRGALEKAGLTDNERTVIKLRFEDEKKVRDCGRILGISCERARQIESKALAKLKNYFEKENEQMPAKKDLVAKEQIIADYQNGMPCKEILAKYGLKRSTFSRYLASWNAEGLLDLRLQPTSEHKEKPAPAATETSSCQNGISDISILPETENVKPEMPDTENFTDIDFCSAVSRLNILEDVVNKLRDLYDDVSVACKHADNRSGYSQIVFAVDGELYQIFIGRGE